MSEQRISRKTRYGRINALTLALSRIVQYFNRWRLALLIFLLIYTAFLLLDLGFGAVLWDEPPHLNDGLLLSRGQLQEYVQEGSRYPPLFDLITALYFKIFGISVFSARLVAVTFGVLSVWAVFEFAHRLYGPRSALISSVLLASMPGFVWLSRMALLETMLIFFFSISLLSFFLWMQTNNNKMLLLSGVTLGLAFLVKYQALVGGIIMLATMFIWGRERIRAKIGKFLLLLIIAGAVILPLVVFTIIQYAGGGSLDTWLYVAQVGSEGTLTYSRRFPFPVFYLIEMTHPYSDIHPISLVAYIPALLGLGFWLLRRRREDKFSLIWFFVVYAIFEIIPAKSWRYVTLVFPILAVSASGFLLLIWDKLKDDLRKYQTRLCKVDTNKVATAFLICMVLFLVFFSSLNAYSWVKKDHVYVPVDEAGRYVAERAGINETVVLCSGNFFSVDMVEFYLQVYNPDQDEPWSYPELPIDVYTPLFNVTELIERSESMNANYLLLFEHGNNTFFQSELTSQHVLEMMLNSNQFIVENEFGSFPRRIFIIRFSPNP
ncbi:MAG: glycosyltransferase family 39 protein [Candidatus Bathyarchaeum sp.]|nr:MAG: glycosyltransferase family 39 protein [Candidatus Bathyarchaeum sp.]